MHRPATRERRALPLVYACSGCSSAAQTANDVALMMDRSGTAQMSCIAGVGGDVGPLVRLAKSGRPIVAIDGCALGCARASLARHDITPAVHVDLSTRGVRKRMLADPDAADVARIFCELEAPVSALRRA